MLADPHFWRFGLHRTWQHHLNHLAVCCTLLVRDLRAINVHRGLDISVSQQFLLHLYVGACAPKHGRVDVTERMPPDLPDAGANGCRLQLSLEDGSPASAEGPCGWRNPVGFVGWCVRKELITTAAVCFPDAAAPEVPTSPIAGRR
jgi:hypothetical protein